jgi:hypothetical protein
MIWWCGIGEEDDNERSEKSGGIYTERYVRKAQVAAKSYVILIGIAVDYGGKLQGFPTVLPLTLLRSDIVSLLPGITLTV